MIKNDISNFDGTFKIFFHCENLARKNRLIFAKYFSTESFFPNQYPFIKIFRISTLDL